MRKIYKKRFVAKLLLCLLLLGVGSSVQASISWTGEQKQNFWSYSGDYTQIGSTTVWIKGSGISYDKTIAGIKLAYKKNVYLQARSNDGVVFLYLQGGGSYNNNDVTISEGSSTVVSTHVAPKTSTTGAGTEIVFEMKKNTDYTIYSTQQLFIKKLIFYTSSECITLDETQSNQSNSDLITQNSGKYICKTKRTLKAGQWNTFCLPVTIQPENLTSYLKCDAVYQMDSYDPSNHTITFTKTQKSSGQNMYVTCRPCLVKPTEDVVNPIVRDSSPLQITIQITDANLVKESNGLSFKGVLGAENIYTTGDDNSTKFYLNNDGFLVYPTSNSGTNGTIKGLRAYFEFAEGANAAEMTFFFDNSETDGISTIERGVKLDDDRVYTLDGRFIGTASDQLPRGIYIQNGRKFVVK